MSGSEQTEATMREAIICMATESWRVGRVLDRLLTKLDDEEQRRYKSQFRWFMKKVNDALEMAEMKIVNLEGQPFDPGIAATPVNLEEFEPSDDLMVEQMLEPVIMGKDGLLLKTGTITLQKKVEI
jgi:hypothetical protein